MKAGLNKGNGGGERGIYIQEVKPVELGDRLDIKRRGKKEIEDAHFSLCICSVVPHSSNSKGTIVINRGALGQIPKLNLLMFGPGKVMLNLTSNTFGKHSL